ncbi:GNAT family N-acetyltransferase [Nocardia beijingensis]|uniref:GNAT family N-acetyltransferase n=1 Tax=Nocardia beijingensis TaxID=95162 RepID=UPI001895DDA8|nr:GNAT family N-acetyltransferase [Nocardia beijingensis]MBF6466076.1 GNAT family N-acetyltransferase [Nocardia beijingensis]
MTGATDASAARQVLSSSHNSDGAAEGRRREIPRSAIEHATVADVPGLVNALLRGCEKAYENLPGAETGGVQRLIADMASRKHRELTTSLTEYGRTFFVHRAPDGQITGFVEAARRPNGDGQLYAWHILPEYHAMGIGRALMREALQFFGDVDVHSNTTIRTEAYAAHLRLGFSPVGPPTGTPPPMQAAGLVAEQQQLMLPRSARAELLKRWERA